jgi:methionyl-tRNA formyltransferase
MKIVFAGTPDFACEALKSIVAEGFAPALVLTQPDRPAGRGKKIKPGPVKQFAVDHGINVWQPASLKDPGVIAALAALKPDLLIVAAYGLLLPQAVLDIPRLGAINVHASLLPRWRGASPVQAAILAGDTESGISLMQMEAGLDSGPVLAKEALRIREDETAGSLHDRLATLGGSLLARNLPAVADGSIHAVPQDPQQVTHAGKIVPDDARLDWSEAAERNARKVRAYNPVPGAWFELDGERVKCWSAKALQAGANVPGTVLAAGPEGIDIACGEGALRLSELQRPGRRRVSAKEFATQFELAGKHLT